jgi:hypothetical protein
MPRLRPRLHRGKNHQSRKRIMKNIFNFFNRATPRQNDLSPDARAGLLALITDTAKEEGPAKPDRAKTDDICYTLGNALFNYADKETDADIFRQVVQKALDAIQGKNEQKALEKKLRTITFVFSCARGLSLPRNAVNRNSVFLVECALDCLEKMTTHNNTACSKLGPIGYLAINDMLVQPIKARLPAILASINPEDAVDIAWCLQSSKKGNPAYHDFICEQAVEAATRIKDLHSDKRLWALGYIGLNQAEKNSTAAREARHFLLETIKKTESPRQLMDIVSWTRTTINNKTTCDATVDKAAAEKMQNIMNNLDLDLRFSCADEAALFAKCSGQTFDTAIRTIIAAAQEYAAAGRFPGSVTEALNLIVRHELIGSQEARKILALLPPPVQSLTAPEERPRIPSQNLPNP